MKTNLRQLKHKSTLSDAVIHIINGLVDQPADVSRDRRQLAVVCRDGFEINAAMERLAKWRGLFGSGAA